eukprot:7590929-Alexandrium_andersonii.AAC.1
MWVNQRIGADGVATFTSSWVDPTEVPPDDPLQQQPRLQEDLPPIATSLHAVAPDAPPPADEPLGALPP